MLFVENAIGRQIWTAAFDVFREIWKICWLNNCHVKKKDDMDCNWRGFTVFPYAVGVMNLRKTIFRCYHVYLVVLSNIFYKILLYKLIRNA